MSGRRDKKVRKEIRAQYSEVAREMAELKHQVFRPRPKWIPLGVYRWLLGFFIIIKKP